MGRKKFQREAPLYDMYVIGEQIRCQMCEQGHIKDRRQVLRKHRKCFIGKDTVDWLVRMCHVVTRKEAVKSMEILKQIGFIRHVSGEQGFKDSNSIYRFTRDDDTFKANSVLAAFYRGLEIFNSLKRNGKDVLRDIYHKGILHKGAFHGCDVIDFLQVSEGIQDRDAIIHQMRDLLERDVIKHVTDDYHFNDDHLIYEFSIDFNRCHVLQDLLDIASDSKGITSDGGGTGQLGSTADDTVEGGHIETQKNGSEVSSSQPQGPRLINDSGDDGDEDINMDEFEIVPRQSESAKQNGHLASQRTQSNFEWDQQDSKLPYIQRNITIVPDDLGLGFVFGGSSPCRVKRVEPLGPAAAAGIKIHQCVAKVNGKDVFTMDHQQVRDIIVHNSGRPLQITVLTYRQSHKRRSRRTSFMEQVQRRTSLN